MKPTMSRKFKKIDVALGVEAIFRQTTLDARKKQGKSAGPQLVIKGSRLVSRESGK